MHQINCYVPNWGNWIDAFHIKSGNRNEIKWDSSKKKRERENTGHVSQCFLVHLKFSSLKSSPFLCIEQWSPLPLSCCKSLTDQHPKIQSNSEMTHLKPSSLNSDWLPVNSKQFDTPPKMPRVFFLQNIIWLTAFCIFFQYSNFTVCLELSSVLQLKLQLTAEKSQATCWQLDNCKPTLLVVFKQ